MADFNLDTSGDVRTRWDMAVQWQQLSPFVQGYVEALFASMERAETGRPALPWPSNGSGNLWGVGFSDLAPETLARIIADCEGARDGYRAANTKACGASFWAGRNDPAGCWRYLVTDGFPPLTVRLGDDGRVRFTDVEA